MKRVAVLGAGIQGVCAALELARRGCAVDLYDSAPMPISGASLWNEGKIHLGFVFANDPAVRTARSLMRGSLQFETLLRRWGVDGVAALASEPFNYAVHRRSMVDVEAVDMHFAAVAAQYEELRALRGAGYLAAESHTPFERLATEQCRRHYDDAQVVAAYRTIERSIQPQVLALKLREALAAAPRTIFRGATTVDGVVQRDDGRLAVAATGDGASRQPAPYDSIVNALWSDRLRVDAMLGLVPARPWLFRYKLAIHVSLDRPASSCPPSTTVLLGPFGDIASFDRKRFYLSWYPACRIAASGDLAPPDWPAVVTEETRRAVLATTVSELARIVPAVGQLPLREAAIDVEGGTIFSWGDADITDPASEIHQRHDIGVHSRGAYHSIDTGKYCMAPLFAMHVADAVCPP